VGRGEGDIGNEEKIRRYREAGRIMEIE